VRNNPINFIDPSGHGRDCGLSLGTGCVQDPESGSLPPEIDPPVGNGGGNDEIIDSDDGTNGEETDPVVALLRNASTVLDVVAWGIDLYNAGVVTYGGIFGAGVAAPFVAVGVPEIPAVTGLAGMGLAELAVQPALRLANNIALVSTLLTVAADVRAGDTNMEQGIIATTTLNSVTTTVYGYIIPEAYLSLIGQSITVSNDLGWTSFPFSNRSE
jgi:hypothetical protein